MSRQRQVVLITGASRGLGRRLALGFGTSGYRVAVHFASAQHDADEVTAEIRRAGGDAVPVRADLSSPDRVERMIQQILDAWGRIDLLVNNAAIIADAPLVSLSEEAWDRVVGVNLSGPFYTMRAVAGIMGEQGGGGIINIVSAAGIRGSRGQANYAAAKAGLIGLTRTAAREWGPLNIRVNAVSPGFMETDMTKTVSDGVKGRALEQSCLDRYSDPEEVVLFVKGLTGMPGVTGQVFHLDSRIV